MPDIEDDTPRARIEQVLDSEYAVVQLRRIAERLRRETGLFIDWIEIKVKSDS